MKRSRQIRLLLLGSFCTGALTSCSDKTGPESNSPRVYPNDYQVDKLGYYHAPYGAFYARRYNDYDPQRKLYFHGGLWTPLPHQSVVNLSEPGPEAQRLLNNLNPPGIHRGGFGGTSHGRYFHS